MIRAYAAAVSTQLHLPSRRPTDRPTDPNQHRATRREFPCPNIVRDVGFDAE